MLLSYISGYDRSFHHFFIYVANCCFCISQHIQEAEKITEVGKNRNGIKFYNALSKQKGPILGLRAGSPFEFKWHLSRNWLS